MDFSFLEKLDKVQSSKSHPNQGYIIIIKKYNIHLPKIKTSNMLWNIRNAPFQHNEIDHQMYVW